jgi:hypothetical protein
MFKRDILKTLSGWAEKKEERKIFEQDYPIEELLQAIFFPIQSLGACWKLLKNIPTKKIS